MTSGVRHARRAASDEPARSHRFDRNGHAGERAGAQPHLLPDRVGVLVAMFMALAVVLGGASRDNGLQLLAIEAAAAPLLVLGLAELFSHGPEPDAVPVYLLATVFLVPAVQLIPLPPAIWERLPGRTEAAALARAAGMAPHWAPLSLTPTETARDLLFLIPPAATFLVATRLSSRARRLVAGVIICLAGFSLFLGVLQLIGPAQSFLYPYETTNVGSAVGLFSNRNHQATLFLCAIPLATAFAAIPSPRFSPLTRVYIAALVVAVFVIGLAGARSRAGIILAGPAVVASLALVLRSKAVADRGRSALIVSAIAVVVLVLVMQFGLSAIVQRFEEPQNQEARSLALPTELRLGAAYAPVGTGLGAFGAAFQSVEPVKMLGPSYLNHAHNDYIELWIETGWVGPLVLAAFLAWFIWRAIGVWRVQGGQTGVTLARAGVIVIALILLHSTVDYPLRTPALAAVFAFACALIAGPPQAQAAVHRARRRRSRAAADGQEKSTA